MLKVRRGKVKKMATAGREVDVNYIINLNEVITTLEKNEFPEHRWVELGLKLHISQAKLDSVGADNPLNVKACLRGCLAHWLRQSYDVDKYGKPTIELLATAVREMELRAVVSRIKQGSTRSQIQSPKEIKHIIEVYSSSRIKNLNGEFALFKTHLLRRLSKHI
uniref:Death domain-containing protein n=1 Tax=Amphimedon queenslandica TaxID=400682 RepID=A0A1X7T7Y0_AMPQE